MRKGSRLSKVALPSMLLVALGSQGGAVAKAPGELERRGLESSSAPFSLTASDGTGLRVVALRARAVVEEPLAFTELQLTFQNPEARVVEGRFEVTLPPGATLSRFAMRQEQGWQEGEVVELEAARAAYEDFLHRRQDPALLEKQAGNRFQARVFPIPAGGRKELILSYSQELRSAGEPYRLHLRGLPRLDHLDVRVLVGKSQLAPGGSSLGGATLRRDVVVVEKKGIVPDADLEVPLPTTSAAGLRHENLAVARLRPIGEAKPEPVKSVVFLFDTSASRALGFERQVKRLAALVDELREVSGARTPIALVAFDQGVEEIFRGRLDGLGASHFAKLTARRALGASDLGLALSYVADLRGRRYERVVLVSDGIATAGDTETDALRAKVAALRKKGIRRLDALVDGGLRDERLLRALTTAGLASHGIVADAALPPSTLARKLSSATFNGVEVAVAGARWSWPKSLDGLQAGDDVLVYADLPKTKPFVVELGGGVEAERTVALAETARPLLERAWVGARIEKLTHERSTVASGNADLRNAIQKEIVALSTRHRVLSDYTALLVLETEADYARFHIDRRALADILTVGLTGLEVVNRKTAPIIAILPPRPSDAVLKRIPEKEKDSVAAKSAAPRVVDDHAPVTTPPPEAPPAAAQHEPAADQSEASHGMGRASAPRPPMMRIANPGAAAETQVDGRRYRIRGRIARPSRVVVAEPTRRREQPKPPEATALSGAFSEVMALIQAGKAALALSRARAWREEAPGDVLALIALGEALEAVGERDEAARAYGSIIDLFPSRADLRRYAGARLERLGAVGLRLAVDTFGKAAAQRADHPASHRLLAFALARLGRYEEAFAAIAKGASRKYPEGRFPGVDRILREDVGLLGAAWIRSAPDERANIAERVSKLGATLPKGPSLRFVLNWETDANDVDFHIYDGREGHAYYRQKGLPTGGELYADVTRGYGPECFTIEGTPKAYPYTLRAHYYSRGPMGYGMGKLQILEHDGEGGLRFEERPFVVMNDGAYVDLGIVKGPLAK